MDSSIKKDTFACQTKKHFTTTGKGITPTQMKDSLFIKAALSQQTERPPVWMMRQAGRFMPQYWEIKNKYSFLEMCKTPEIAADVTMLPVDLLGIDAAILFSDI